MYQEGDLVEIPLPSGRIAVGLILHVSKYFKHAVGFIVFGIQGTKLNDIVIPDDSGIYLSKTFLGPLYTHIDNLKTTGWKVIAHQPVSEAKRQLTRRQVGGGIYVADEYLGSADELGESSLKPMLSMGMPVIYAEIESAFGGSKMPAP
jgi:hypothetical protein